ncbi:MAG: GNAT family N-acetyltransferase [Candidatus Edwardsbacteria bacterium]|nr:GNAT family N-acetyltransferase [Candidatus Edwardsbacteria bacterium]MBU1575884.1 GNAT family N-acetyltransferase [Candidatus Edwardsbacteria bacterium]
MTDGLTLRSPRPDEMEYIQKLWADPLTMAEVGGPIHLTDEQAEKLYARMISPGSETDRYFLIFNQNDQPVGEISFHRYDPSSGTAEFNIKIEHQHRSKGYAKKAVPLLLRYFFFDFGGKIMCDPVAPDNQPGQKALIKFGFKKDILRQDVCLLKMTKEDFSDIYGNITP